MTDQITVSRELLRQVLDAFETYAKQYPHMWKGYLLDAEQALRDALEQPAVEPVNFDQIAVDRYKVVKAHESLFHRWAVVAGNGTRQLYLGRELECQNMARKFAGAFLDGAWLASQHTAPQAQQPADVPKCNPHPKAPHGFDRNSSRSEDRYVCECESWEPYQAGLKAEQAQELEGKK